MNRRRRVPRWWSFAPLLALSGCGTLICVLPIEGQRFGIPRWGKPELDPYGGVRRDVAILGRGFWPMALDLPLSAALDTLLLPITGIAWLFTDEPDPPIMPTPDLRPSDEPERLVVDAPLEARFEGASSTRFTAWLASGRRHTVEVRAAPGVLDRLWLGGRDGGMWVHAPTGGSDHLRAVVEPSGSGQWTIEVWPAAVSGERSFEVSLLRDDSTP